MPRLSGPVEGNAHARSKELRMLTPPRKEQMEEIEKSMEIVQEGSEINMVPGEILATLENILPISTRAPTCLHPLMR